MGTVRIQEEFSKGYYWIEVLEPSLKEINLKFQQFLLVAALIPYESYIGFIRVEHIVKDETKYGLWFSK